MRSFMMPVLLTSALSLASSAGAAVVTSNLSETRFGDNGIGGTNFGVPLSIANRFTAGAGTWSIDSVSVSMQDFGTATPDNYQLQIRDDASGTPGSTVLGNFNMAANNVGGSFAAYTYTPSAGLSLTGGSYWLVGIPTAPATGYQWANTASTSTASVSGWSIDDRQWATSNTNGTTWTRDPEQLRLQFSVAATLVPEPTSLAALALSSLVLKRRRTSC